MAEDQHAYRPIDCGLHSRYELAIMRGTRLRLVWTNQQGILCEETLTPLDMKTSVSKEEFLVAEDARGQRLEIRLDRIRETPFSDNHERS